MTAVEAMKPHRLAFDVWRGWHRQHKRSTSQRVLARQLGRTPGELHRYWRRADEAGELADGLSRELGRAIVRALRRQVVEQLRSRQGVLDLLV